MLNYLTGTPISTKNKVSLFSINWNDVHSWLKVWYLMDSLVNSTKHGDTLHAINLISCKASTIYNTSLPSMQASPKTWDQSHCNECSCYLKRNVIIFLHHTIIFHYYDLFQLQCLWMKWTMICNKKIHD